MYSCDVLIVGAGPAGSSCAWALRSSGLKVLLLDKSRFPRNKVCGGWITPRVLELLQINLADYRRGRVLQNITGFGVSTMGHQEAKVHYGRNVSYGIRRCEFDDYLLRRSQVQMIEGIPITRIERSANGWIVNGDIKAGLLIGAGGHFCPVSRFLGNTNHEQPVIAQEAEFEMTTGQASSCRIRPETPELYFCEDLQGYGWCFRKGNFINIGMGRLDQHHLPRYMERFLHFLRKSGKLDFELPIRPQGHAYLLLGNSQRRVVDDSVLLIGDAAGLAYAQSGEGICPAIESGLLAAEITLSSHGHYSRKQLNPYTDLLRARLDQNAGYAETVAKYLPTALRNSLARLLLKTEWFCRTVVVESWFLHWMNGQERPM